MVTVKARSEGYVRASTDVTGSSGKERAQEVGNVKSKMGCAK